MKKPVIGAKMGKLFEGLAKMIAECVAEAVYGTPLH